MKDKKYFENFLNKLSDANKKEYGDKTLDCCELNKSPKNTKVAKNYNDKEKSKIK